MKALGPRQACLLANHGAVAVAESLRKAYESAGEVEVLASQYARALQIGRPQTVVGARDGARDREVQNLRQADGGKADMSVVLITGAAKRLGRAIALKLAGDGL